MAGYPARWAIDATTPAGQSMLSILLTAHAMHQVVKLSGTNTCPTGANSEGVAVVVTNDAQ
jgi:hypothetical protein